jgi:cytochrome P450
MLAASDDARRDPYPAYRHLRRTAPVVRDPGSGAWMLLAHDTVKHVLTDHATFSSVGPDPGATGSWLVFMDPPRHTRLRALISRAFVPRAIANLEPRVESLAHALFDRASDMAAADPQPHGELAARGRAGAPAARVALEVMSALAVPLPLMVIAELLGAPADDHPRFRRWSNAILGLIHTVSGDPQGPTAVAAFERTTEEMRAYLDDMLTRRVPGDTTHLLGGLAEARVDGERLHLDDMLGFFQLLLFAGHETTTNLIGNALLCFLDHPDALARVREHPELLPSAIEEVLRFRSPVQAVFRYPRHDVDLGGQRLLAGALVLPMIGAANRDPARFRDPDAFDVTRSPNPHIAFGSGVHFCIGMALARLEARVVLRVLLERWAAFALAPDGWAPREAFHVHGPERLFLHVTAAAR